MKEAELKEMAKKCDGYQWTVKHRITVEPGKTDEKFEELVKSVEMLLWRITKDKDKMPEGFYKWLYNSFVIDLYEAGVKEVYCEDNHGNCADFDIEEIYEKEICEDF